MADVFGCNKNIAGIRALLLNVIWITMLWVWLVNVAIQDEQVKQQVTTLTSSTLWQPHETFFKRLYKDSTENCLCYNTDADFRNITTSTLAFVDTNGQGILVGRPLPVALNILVYSSAPACADVLEAIFAGVNGPNAITVPARITPLPDGTHQISGDLHLPGIYELRVRTPQSSLICTSS